MKYLRDDFLEEFDFSSDAQKKELWLQGCREYRQYFNSIKNRFPKDFCEVYISTEFHDFILKDFKFELTQNKTYNLILTFSENDRQHILTFCNVKSFSTDLILAKKIYQHFGEHILGEFTEVLPDVLKYEFVLNDMENNSRFIIEFQSLQYHKS